MSFRAWTLLIVLTVPVPVPGTRSGLVFQKTRPDLVTDRNRAYVDGGTADQTLDFEAPAGAKGFATVLFLHGGSLQESGERRSSPVYARVCEPFLAAGIACASADYRLAPTHKWPAMPLDAAAAVKWVRARATAVGGDPAKVFVFGHSSGCHLAAILGANRSTSRRPV